MFKSGFWKAKYWASKYFAGLSEEPITPQGTRRKKTYGYQEPEEPLYLEQEDEILALFSSAIME